MLNSASSPNKLILPRIKSEMRGCDPEKLRGSCLAHFGLGKVAISRSHQDGAQFHVFCLLRRVFDGIPNTGKSLIAH